MDDIYEGVKSRGWKKNDPGHSKEWREMHRADRRKRSCKIRRHCRVKVRRDLIKLSQNEHRMTPKADEVLWNKFMPYGEHKESLGMRKTIKHWKVLRTNIFCKICEFKFCKHRNDFGAVIFIILWKRKLELLRGVPKDIIFLMSKMILDAQNDFFSSQITSIFQVTDHNDHVMDHVF